MIDLSPLARRLAGTPLAAWANTLQAQLDVKMEKGHGDLERWQSALDALPDVKPTEIDLLNGLTLDTDCDDATRTQMRQALMGLSPWRKGPFDLFGVHVDTEWHSDWKWSRVAPHINLKHKRILDVGCGNGYYMWRMLGAGAHSVIGVDPNWLFFCQFQAVQRFLQQEAAWHLPFPFEDLPPNLEGFDTVFSMGVFYHRRSPIEHLLALKDCLVKGGELVLETLVIEGDVNQVLVPEDRYAQMRNVWFLPSIPALERWLRRAGFSDVRCVDVSTTTVEEQRATEWMKFQSLSDYLDPNDPGKTVEGLPAPFLLGQCLLHRARVDQARLDQVPAQQPAHLVVAQRGGRNEDPYAMDGVGGQVKEQALACFDETFGVSPQVFVVCELHGEGARRGVDRMPARRLVRRVSSSSEVSTMGGMS